MRLAIVIATLLVTGCAERDDSDPPNGHSGFAVFTDALTGCQYIGWGSGYEGKALTPRMDAYGKQVCRPTSAGGNR